MEAANGGAHVAVGSRSYGAGIQDDNIGELGNAGADHSLGAQLAIYNSTIGLGGPASEVLNVKAGHGDIITAEFSGQITTACCQTTESYPAASLDARKRVFQ